MHKAIRLGDLSRRVREELNPEVTALIDQHHADRALSLAEVHNSVASVRAKMSRGEKPDTEESQLLDNQEAIVAAIKQRFVAMKAQVIREILRSAPTEQQGLAIAYLTYHPSIVATGFADQRIAIDDADHERVLAPA